MKRGYLFGLILLSLMSTVPTTGITGSTASRPISTITLNGHNKPLLIRESNQFLNIRLHIEDAPGSIIENQVLTSLVIVNSENTIARNNTILDGTIVIARSSNSTIHDNVVESMQFDTGISIFSSNITVQNNRITRTSFDPEPLQMGIFIDNVNSQHWFFQDGIYPLSFNIRVINNTIINFYHGIIIDGDIPDIVLLNNHVEESVLGIHIWSRDMVIEGNFIEFVDYYHKPELQTRGLNPGLSIRGGDNFLIKNNRISHVGSFAMEIGPGVRNVSIINNIIDDAPKGGIWVRNAETLSVINNTIIGTNLLLEDLLTNYDYSDSNITGNTIINAKPTFALAGIRVRNLDGITISENHILGAEVTGLDIVDQNGGIILGNEIRDIEGHGIELRSESKSLKIENNQIFNVTGDPIHVNDDDKVKQNTFIDNVYEGELVSPTVAEDFDFYQFFIAIIVIIILGVILKKNIRRRNNMKHDPTK